MAEILFIAPGFPPFEFSENIVNGKLVLAFLKAGHKVTVITKVDEGDTYSSEWRDPWLPLKEVTHVIKVPSSNNFTRFLQVIQGVILFKFPLVGLRWAHLAYRESKRLIKEKKIEILITRSPNDIGHILGLRLKKEFKITWFANWNDPSDAIWPPPYDMKMPFWEKIISNRFASKVMACADLITFPSEMLFLHFTRFFNIDNSKVHIVPHIMLEPNQVIHSTDNTGDLHLMHSGNLSKERDPAILLEAIQKFNMLGKGKIFLDILGVVSLDTLNLINNLQITEYINVRKPLPYSEAMKLMANYDVLVIIEARMERGIFLPSKISDYVQLGKPIFSISPERGEIAGIFEKFGGGIIADNNSIDDIFNKLTHLMQLKLDGNLSKEFNYIKLREYLNAGKVVSVYSNSARAQ